jgi:LPXTG-motif cell wall-anchored protein
MPAPPPHVAFEQATPSTAPKRHHVAAAAAGLAVALGALLHLRRRRHD